MKIVVAPDSFKESLSAAQACQAIKEGFSRIFPDASYVLVPMADGGEGTVDAMVGAVSGERVAVEVTGPLGNAVTAHFGLINGGKTAIIEMAEASGLHLVPVEQRNPWLASSRGTGELIKAALDAGCRHLIIGIGGSATVDGGAGCLAALGAQLDCEAGAQGLSRLTQVDLSTLDPRIQDCEMEVACDVTNPLLGDNGAAAVYAPQKGARPEDIPHLEAALENFANLIEGELGHSYRNEPGAGAAGGMGFCLAGPLGATIRSGVRLLADCVGLPKSLKGADLLLTGEGQINSQSVCGKVITGVAELAGDIPVIAFAGSLEKGYEAVYDAGIQAVQVLADGPRSLDDCLDNAYPLLLGAAERAARLIRI